MLYINKIYDAIELCFTEDIEHLSKDLNINFREPLEYLENIDYAELYDSVMLHLYKYQKERTIKAIKLGVILFILAMIIYFCILAFSN